MIQINSAGQRCGGAVKINRLMRGSFESGMETATQE